MIFKVYFQESKSEVPVREKTQTVYVEAESEREVRLKLAKFDYNIELITPVEGKYLEFEKQSPDFHVLEL